MNFDPNTRKPVYNKQYLKWLNLKSLTQAFIHPKNEKLVEVHYFSAFAKWLPDPYNRHLDYVKALESVGVKVCMGNFKQKNATCKSCKANWITHEEKETDVNLAIQLIKHAYEDTYDKAYLITADTDIIPAVKLIKQTFPKKEITVLIPARRFQYAMELRNICHEARKIKESNLEKNIFQEIIVDENGEVIVTRPTKYRPPKNWIPPI